jgi:hypothetical protein
MNICKRTLIIILGVSNVECSLWLHASSDYYSVVYLFAIGFFCFFSLLLMSFDPHSSFPLCLGKRSFHFFSSRLKLIIKLIVFFIMFFLLFRFILYVFHCNITNAILIIIATICFLPT